MIEKIKIGRLGVFFAFAVSVLVAGSGTAWPGEDHDRVLELKEAGEIVPLEVIIEKARAIRSGRLLEVELETEHGKLLYELEFLDEKGVVWELEYDARTGELFEIEQEKNTESEQ